MAINCAVSLGGEGGEADGVGRPKVSVGGGMREAEEAEDDDVVDVLERGGEGRSPLLAVPDGVNIDMEGGSREPKWVGFGLTVARDDSDKIEPTRGRFLGSSLPTPRIGIVAGPGGCVSREPAVAYPPVEDATEVWATWPYRSSISMSKS